MSALRKAWGCMQQGPDGDSPRGAQRGGGGQRDVYRRGGGTASKVRRWGRISGGGEGEVIEADRQVWEEGQVVRVRVQRWWAARCVLWEGDASKVRRGGEKGEAA